MFKQVGSNGIVFVMSDRVYRFQSNSFVRYRGSTTEWSEFYYHLPIL